MISGWGISETLEKHCVSEGTPGLAASGAMGLGLPNRYSGLYFGQNRMLSVFLSISTCPSAIVGKSAYLGKKLKRCQPRANISRYSVFHGTTGSGGARAGLLASPGPRRCRPGLLRHPKAGGPAGHLVPRGCVCRHRGGVSCCVLRVQKVLSNKSIFSGCFVPSALH